MGSEKDDRLRRVIAASSFGEYADSWIICDAGFIVLAKSDPERGTSWRARMGENILPFLSESFAERIISTDDRARGLMRTGRDNMRVVAVWARVDNTKCLVFLPDVCSPACGEAVPDSTMRMIYDKVGDFVTSTVRESLTRTGNTPRLRALNMLPVRRLRKSFAAGILRPEPRGRAGEAIPVESLLSCAVGSVRAGLVGSGCQVENISTCGGQHFCTCGDRFMMGFIMTLIFSTLMLSGGRHVFVGMEIKDPDGGGAGGVMTVESDFSYGDIPKDGKADLMTLASELMNDCVFPAAPELMICAEAARSLGWESGCYVSGGRFGLAVRFMGMTGAGLTYRPNTYTAISREADILSMGYANDLSEYRRIVRDPWELLTPLRRVCRAPEAEYTTAFERKMSREGERERERERERDYEYETPEPESDEDEYPMYGEPARSPSPYRY